jgi:hypothetical protein
MTSPPKDLDYQRSGASYRDPSGFVFQLDGILYRQINQLYRDPYLHLMDSGLYEALVEKQYLIPHEEVSIPPPQPELAFKIIRPERLDFISYPYEWSFSQLKDAALTTLNIQKLALQYDMSLKDSSAYNVQFHQGRPILIDTLSFERYQIGRPWVAYRQFCQHFLAPLSLMAYQDTRLAGLLKDYIDGLPLDLTTRLLPLRTRFNPTLLLHLHLHASSQKRYAGVKPDSRRSLNQSAFLGLIESLESAVNRLQWKGTDAGWAGYYQDEHSYSNVGLEHKQQLIQKYLGQTCETGAYTVAFDFDPAVVDLNYREIKARQETRLLPLLQDLTNPSPAIGWQNRERASLKERANADAVLALALIHHLAIANNVPLDQLAAFFQKLAKWLIVEFVPKSDPQVQRLLFAREDIFTEYTLDRFESEFSKYYKIHSGETVLESSRRIYLMERL